MVHFSHSSGTRAFRLITLLCWGCWNLALLFLYGAVNPQQRLPGTNGDLGEVWMQASSVCFRNACFDTQLVRVQVYIRDGDHI